MRTEEHASRQMESGVVVSTGGQHHGTVQYHQRYVSHSASTQAIHDVCVAGDPQPEPEQKPVPLGRRHSSAAIIPPPPPPSTTSSTGAEEVPTRKTVTSYSFRERSPRACDSKPSNAAGHRAAVVRFRSDEPASGHHHHQQHDDAKQLFLSVPATSRSGTVQWSDERIEMTLMSEPTSGLRRSASSLKSPTRSASNGRVPATQPAAGSQHTRSQSMRVGCKPPSQKDEERRRAALQVPAPHRPRGTSLPSHRVLVDGASADGRRAEDDEPADYYLIRQFIVRGKSNKVVNRGDSVRKLARNPPACSTACPSSSEQQQEQQQQAASSSQLHLSLSGDNGSASPTTGGSTLTADASPRRASQWTVHQAAPASADGASPPPPPEQPLRVVMLGASGVGKTALTAQFMTSEYLNTYEASLDDDACDRCVSVLLDGEESQLVFIDHPHGEISVENCMSTYNPHAYVIVYSVVDVESVRTAEEILHFLWRRNSAASLAAPPVVILVANKIDLVRSRAVSPQAGKSLATSFDCKYIETSSGMQHNVDELLVGVLKQIRLKTLWHQQVVEHINCSSSASVSSSARSLFRKRSGRRRKPEAWDGANQSAEVVSIASQEEVAGGLVGSVVDCCGIVPSSSAAGAVAASLSFLPSSLGLKSSSAGRTSSGWSPNGHHRRSASLRVRKMLGKAVWACADYYGGKSRSCEDLHVL